MKPTSKYSTDYFLYDLDGEFDEKGFIDQVSEHTQIIMRLPTPNGMHFLVKPFNYNLVNNNFKFSFKHVEFKQDALINLI